ncbi:MAG: ribonuclease J [Defluviitaleaceae bacterium]|nr:ribonuclease J [Defluviitaleaceae bacterium]MCL2239195.1 ribonuclease J [Defluviitaleaceae bacterium]
MAAKKNKLRVFALGGLGEIGKNMTVLEYGNDLIVIDCGVAFPQDEMLGVDLVIPDFSYLIQNHHKIRGLFLTHAHEDHIGSVPYLLRELSVRIFGTRLTLGLVANKLKEHGLSSQAEMTCINPGEAVNVGCFGVEFIRVTHSVADSVAIAVETPVGTVIHSGDFKVDFTPIQGEPMDLQRFAVLGDRGVRLFLCESTNVLFKGYTMSERNVGRVFEQIFEESTNQRIMVAMFSSNIDRIQQVLNSAVRHKRKTLFMGRSMVNAVRTATELGYLDIPKGQVIDVNEARNYTPQQLCIVTTGSQGEQMAALSRMASSDHRQIVVTPSDKIVISASPIPGNEKMISRVINDLLKLGAEVIYEGMMEVHVSGHAKEEELKLMHALIRPQYLMPVHGEFRHLKHHKDLAVSMGMPKEDVFLMDIGQVLEITGKEAKINGIVPSGQLLVDGLGVGDVGNVVLRDRKHLSEDGLIIAAVGVSLHDGACQIISGPEIISRGFVYVRENDDLMQGARSIVSETLFEVEQKNTSDMQYIKNRIRDDLKEFIWQRTKRNPMIFPILLEV